ncbi:MAG TPA: nucleoside 2-deoxyribosyltransferase [Beijerinckiaceae bacterium]
MLDVTRRPKLYLAGPDVFLPQAIEIGRVKKRLCAQYGFEGLYPFDNEVSPAHGEAVDRLIYRANVAMIREADGGVFNLTPFRGPSADVGTVFELGFLSALGKAAFGYSNQTEDLLTRVKTNVDVRRDKSTSAWRDPQGMSIEDFGNADNLMIDACLAEQGRPLIRIETSKEERFTALKGFEACLGLAALEFGTLVRQAIG